MFIRVFCWLSTHVVEMIDVTAETYVYCVECISLCLYVYEVA